jgi:nucleoside phosphorylase
MDRENRQAYGFFRDLNDALHVNLLVHALNVAVFLCHEFCVVTPGPVSDCGLARLALERRDAFIRHGLVRLPLREPSVSEFIEKRLRQYNPQRHLFPDLYSEDARAFLAKYPELILPRRTAAGVFIAERWIHRKADDPVWVRSTAKLTKRQAENLTRIPLMLVEKGVAANWPAVASSLRKNIGIGDPRPFRGPLQADHFTAYTTEFSLARLSRLPLVRDLRSLRPPDLCYDYEGIREALTVVGIWPFLEVMSAEAIVALRSRNGFFAFRQAYHRLAQSTKVPREVGRALARAADAERRAFRDTQEVDDLPKLMFPPDRGWDCTTETLDAIEHRLDAVAKHIHPYDDAQRRTSRARRTNLTVAVFVALEEEREFLVQRWRLSQKYGDVAWTQRVGRVDVAVYGPDEPGRVAAAVATLELLRSMTPALVVVTGLAGGFKSSGVDLGDVLVADTVADLATRKIRNDAESVRAEFRPRTFRTDSRLRDFFKSGSFQASDWEARILSDAAWPKGRRPALRYGTIASLDEIVSSDTWQQRLIEAWPELLGVEMEAGGVCRAVARARLPVAVIRGVSDLADPMKADDRWRRIAIHTVASLLETSFESSEWTKSL